MSIDSERDLFDYLTEASETVSNWPIWKQSGSDATQFQDTQQNLRTHEVESTCFAPKRIIAS